MSDSAASAVRAQARSMWKKLFEELSECPICLDNCPEKKLELRCHHVICEACAGRLKTDRNITCPFCKRRQRFGRAKVDQRSELFREAAQEKYRKLFDTGDCVKCRVHVDDVTTTAEAALLVCPKCRQLSRDPKRLPCNHSLCSTCVDIVTADGITRCSVCFCESDVERVVPDFRLQSFYDGIKEVADKLREEGICTACLAMSPWLLGASHVSRSPIIAADVTIAGEEAHPRHDVECQSRQNLPRTPPRNQRQRQHRRHQAHGHQRQPRRVQAHQQQPEPQNNAQALRPGYELQLQLNQHPHEHQQIAQPTQQLNQQVHGHQQVAQPIQQLNQQAHGHQQVAQPIQPLNQQVQEHLQLAQFAIQHLDQQIHQHQQSAQPVIQQLNQQAQEHPQLAQLIQQLNQQAQEHQQIAQLALQQLNQQAQLHQQLAHLAFRQLSHQVQEHQHFAQLAFQEVSQQAQEHQQLTQLTIQQLSQQAQRPFQ